MFTALAVSTAQASTGQTHYHHRSPHPSCFCSRCSSNTLPVGLEVEKGEWRPSSYQRLLTFEPAEYTTGIRMLRSSAARGSALPPCHRPSACSSDAVLASTAVAEVSSQDELELAPVCPPVVQSLLFNSHSGGEHVRSAHRDFHVTGVVSPAARLGRC